jgi:tetratricopeptide (TPR) repeat protein
LARKAPQHGHTSAPLEPRIHRALKEGRFQQALDLAKQLHKQEPTTARLELLKKTYLGRSKQLREQGHGRDAITMLDVALRLDASPVWLEQVARELAQAGAIAQALALAEKLPPETPGRPAIRAHAVDAAFFLETGGREQLPPALQPEFDRLVLAFGQVESGQDEQAKTTLQEIGLRSPFLEWKVLLRGFLAYYQNDDVRALENWQRLAPDRLPARVAAPFRYQLDPAYRAAQSAAAQTLLQGQLDRVQGSVLPQELRRLRKALEHQETLAGAFRQAEALLPQLKQAAPQLVPRLASCYYWAATETGPEDVARYQRVFGAPPHDPHFNRLHALAYDRARDVNRAHPYWQAYEKELADHPEIFPAGQAVPARALIWLHMGQNAATVPTKKKLAKLPKFLRDHPDRPKAVEPAADVCFEKAIELMPEQAEPYEELFEYFLVEEQFAKATRAAKRLLGRFPDHVPTLTSLGDVYMKDERYPDAQAVFQRALQGNPLDRELRQRLGAAHLFQARVDVEQGRFDAARQHYDAAAPLEGEKEQWMLFTRRAACEFKAGETARAEEWLQQAVSRAPDPLAVSFRMLTEAIRLKLPRALKTRFDKEYKAGLAAPVVPEAAAELVEFLASLKELGVTYNGLKTHESAILKYTSKAQKVRWGARQLESVIRALLKLKAIKPARRLIGPAKQRFRADPVFLFLEATSYFLEGPDRLPPFQVRFMLEEAERLAQALPADENRTKMLDDIHKHQQLLDALDPFVGMPSFFGDLFDQEDYDDDDDELDGW